GGSSWTLSPRSAATGVKNAAQPTLTPRGKGAGPGAHREPLLQKRQHAGQTQPAGAITPHASRAVGQSNVIMPRPDERQDWIRKMFKAEKDGTKHKNNPGGDLTPDKIKAFFRGKVNITWNEKEVDATSGVSSLM